MLETVPSYEFNGTFMKLIQQIQPEEVYIPHRGDIQIDHQMVADAAMVALRPEGITASGAFMLMSPFLRQDGIRPMYKMSLFSMYMRTSRISFHRSLRP